MLAYLGQGYFLFLAKNLQGLQQICFLARMIGSETGTFNMQSMCSTPGLWALLFWHLNLGITGSWLGLESVYTSVFISQTGYL